jgi:acetyltransferase
MVETAKGDKKMQLRNFFNPNAIAIVGASPDITKFQGKILKYLIKHGFEGKIYPVNPSYESVMDYKSYPTLTHIPAKFDLVIVIIRSDKVLGILEEAHSLGCLAAIVISSDFAESGEAGKRRQEKLQRFAHRSGMRILGPNCLGYINFSAKIAASGCTSLEKQALLNGKIGLVTQSGALMGSIFGRAQDEDIGFSLVVSMGNEVDVEAAEVIKYMLQDDNTEVVTGFIETFRNLDNFLDASNLAVQLEKPLVLLKVGQSEKGQQAAATHTAAITGSHDVANALFRRKGIVQINTIDQLYRTANLLSQVGLAEGNRVGIFTISGGACSWLADRCEALGINVPDLSNHTKKKLNEVFQYGFPANPLDITGQAISNQEYFSALLNIFMDDENLDIILIGMTAMPFPKRAAEDIVRAANDCSKPLIVFWTFDKIGEKAYALLRKSNVPLFHSSESCLNGIKQLIEYSKFMRGHRERASYPITSDAEDRKIRAQEYLSDKVGVLTEQESKMLLGIYDIPITKERVAQTLEETIAFAEEIGYPVALKVMSPKIIHKTDIGAVRLSICDKPELERAYFEIMESTKEIVKKSEIFGVLVQEMIQGRAEVFAGIINDQVFGPAVLFGLGGIFVELLDDKTIGVPPLSKAEALSLIKGIRASKVLEGFRQQKKCDLEAIADILVRLGEMAIDLEDYISEIDINPILVFPPDCGLKVVDATVNLKRINKSMVTKEISYE